MVEAARAKTCKNTFYSNNWNLLNNGTDFFVVDESYLKRYIRRLHTFLCNWLHAFSVFREYESHIIIKLKYQRKYWRIRSRVIFALNGVLMCKVHLNDITGSKYTSNDARVSNDAIASYDVIKAYDVTR